MNETIQKKGDSVPRLKTVYHLRFSDPSHDCSHVVRARNPGRTAKKPPARDWTCLDNLKCYHCPLKAAESPACPAADDMAELVERFSNFKSCDRVMIEIQRNDELHVNSTDLQTALAYVFLAIIGHSACPYAPLLTPWVRYGKVFPTMQDVYFMTAAFSALKLPHELLGIEPKRLPPADEDPSYLLSVTFHGLLQRIRSASTLDACVNAIIKDIQWAYAAMRTRNESEKGELETLFATD